MDFISLFGTGASVIIAISLTMKNIRRLRILNALGAIAFTVYGALIGAVPVYALNGFIVFIDLYYLWKMKAQRDRFDVIESDPYASPYVNLFLEHYKKDIWR